MRILLIEDDPGILLGLEKSLKNEKFQVVAASKWSEVENITYDDIDIILLDINLPGVSGIEICKKIRKEYKTPIIFLTARDSEMDQLQGYRVGCDDYITKPFSTPLLIVKIETILKRIKSPNILNYGVISFDMEKMILKKEDKIIRLTSNELKLLNMLLNNPGSVLTKEMLLEKIWMDEPVESNTLNVTINRLRKKIEDDYKNPQYIKNLFGIGYYWDA